MKILIVILSLLLFGYATKAQNQITKDSLGKMLRQKLNQLPPANDYSNTIPYTPQPRTITVAIPKQIPKGTPKQFNIENTIVVIDDKMYSLTSPEYVQLKISDLAEPVTIIEDALSKTGITKILIYKTKNKR